MKASLPNEFCTSMLSPDANIDELAKRCFRDTPLFARKFSIEHYPRAFDVADEGRYAYDEFIHLLEKY